MKSSLATLDLLAGGSVGTLLGVLLGLSASPVVAAAVGALGTALLALLDLGERQAGSTAEEKLVGAGRRLRVISFAAFCVTATVAALVVRTENVLGISEEQSLRARRDAWVKLGLSEGSATALMVRLAEGNRGTADVHPLDPTLGLLFASGAPPDCDQLARFEFKDAKAALEAFHARGGIWARAAAQAEKLPADGPNSNRLATLLSFRDLVCAH
jgi:hypothetical protein